MRGCTYLALTVSTSAEPTSDRVWQLTLTKPRSNSPAYLPRRPMRCLQVEKLTVLVVGRLSALGMRIHARCWRVMQYSFLACSINLFLHSLIGMEDHGRRGPLVLVSRRVVELSGFSADELLTEATLLVRDREPFAGTLFQMVCAKLCTTSLFLSALRDGRLPDPRISLA